jgi:serine/threonine protein phosphatase PrpC
VVLSVADGHGSERHARSDVGAAIATEIVLDLGREFLSLARIEPLSTLKSAAEETFPRKLVQRWRDRVSEHLSEHPMRGPAGEDPVPDEPDGHVMYGTTVLGAVITDRLLVCWQLGDGDILQVSRHGEVSAPLATGPPQLGVETESLAETHAWESVQVHWEPLSAEKPSLVILSTDGLANSFESTEGFQAFGSDTLDRLRREGVDWTRQRLPAWLARATSFSGDDVTVAAAWQDDPLEQISSASENIDAASC